MDDLEIIILSELSQTENDKYYMYHLDVESKIWYKRTCLQNRNRLTDIEDKLTVTREERERGVN